jgi:hypothetical protein
MGLLFIGRDGLLEANVPGALEAEQLEQQIRAIVEG